MYIFITVFYWVLGVGIGFWEFLGAKVKINITNNIEQNHIILLDELEAFYHPMWSKSMIKILIKELNTKSIHLVLTTHSPFLISDLQKENVIFLDTYKKEEDNQKVGDCKNVTKTTNINPFGANIHTLLSDGFFMEDGLMGEFAKGKIQEIMDFHKEVEEENKEEKSNFDLLKIRYEKDKIRFWQTQSIIGEDYLNQVIKNHLRDIENILLGYDEAKKEEIKRLRDEADRLEKM